MGGLRRRLGRRERHADVVVPQPAEPEGALNGYGGREHAARHGAAATRVLRRRVGLRTRITLLFPALTLVLTSMVSLGVYGVVRSSQLSSREAQARDSAFFNASIVQERLSDPLADVGKVVDALRRSSGGESGLLFGRNPDKAPEWYSTNATELNRSDIPVDLNLAVADKRQPVLQRISLRSNEPVVIVGVPIEAVGNSRASYFEFAPLQDLQQTLDNLAVALPGAVALTTLVAILLGHSVARTALAPLTEVSRAAEAIAADKLDTRLPGTEDPELAGIVNSFNNMASALEHRVARDARFASDVSHELRSPLMTLAASVEVLQRRRDEMPERAVAALDLLAADIIRFQSLVADLLEISRFDSGTQELEVGPLQATEFLSQAAFAVTGRQMPVIYSPDLQDQIIVADKRRLVQVLTNLVDNADKYGGGVAAITLDQVDGGIEIGVEDDGPGVPEADRELIFDRFARGSSAGRRGSDGGTGLGLSLVGEHVRLHGGEVWCESARTSATGARFAFFLPTNLSALSDDEDEPLGVGAEP
jgi:signal transduction histidine kinase